VRLRTGLSGRYDLRSGWGISGYDVKEMPDKTTRPKAYAFVRGELNAGRLEGASKAEYDETQVSLTMPDDGVFQERAVRSRAAVAHSKIVSSRRGGDESDAATADEARRKAILKQQSKASKGKAAAEDDDDDEGDDYDAMGKAALVAAANERGVDASGTADAIRDRLRAADEEGDDEDEDDGPEDDDEESESENDSQQS